MCLFEIFLTIYNISNKSLSWFYVSAPIMSIEIYIIHRTELENNFAVDTKIYNDKRRYIYSSYSISVGESMKYKKQSGNYTKFRQINRQSSIYKLREPSQSTYKYKVQDFRTPPRPNFLSTNFAPYLFLGVNLD